MHLLTLICGTLLLSKASTLKCYECKSKEACSNRVTECPANFHCGVMRIVTYAGVSRIADFIVKACTLPQQCINASVNFGSSRNLISSKCCSTDLCNSDTTKSTPNGMKCFSCNGQTCLGTLNCEGDEDHCISTTVTFGGEKTMRKGCASKQICANVNNEQIKGAFGGDISCCQGNYCNGASGTKAGLLLLVAPLISLVVFS